MTKSRRRTLAQLLHTTKILFNNTTWPTVSLTCLYIQMGQATTQSLCKWRPRKNIKYLTIFTPPYIKKAKFEDHDNGCVVLCDYCLSTEPHCLMWYDRWWFVSPLGLSTKLFPAMTMNLKQISPKHINACPKKLYFN